MALTQSKKEERLGSSKYMNCGSLAIIIRYKNARDMKEWAKSHNIELLEIWYYDKTQIEEILKEALCLC